MKRLKTFLRHRNFKNLYLKGSKGMKSPYRKPSNTRYALSILFFLILLFVRICFAISIKGEAEKYRNSGYEAQIRGDLDSALTYYQKAVQIDPHYVVAYNDLGIVYEMKGFLEKAEEVYLKAIQLDPEYLPTYSNLALLYERKPDILKAAHFWKKRIQLGDPNEIWTQKAKERLKSLGLISPEIRKELLEEEVVEFSKEILEEKRRVEEERLAKIKRHFDLGMNCYLKGDYKEAEKEFREVLALDPENLEAKDFFDRARQKTTEAKIKESAELGIKLYTDKDYSQSLKKFEEILTLIQSRISEGLSK